MNIDYTAMVTEWMQWKHDDRAEDQLEAVLRAGGIQDEMSIEVAEDVCWYWQHFSEEPVAFLRREPILRDIVSYYYSVKSAIEQRANG